MDNGAVTRDRPTRLHWALGLLAFVLLAAWPVAKFLLLFPQDQWQVDVQVYREGGVSVLHGRPIYQQMTDPPQLLPFTYPPLAAFFSVPLALVPFPVAAWAWTISQLLADLAIAWVAWYHVRDRVGRWAPVVVGAVAGAFLWTQPVGDGIRFAQVNAFLVLLILLDLKRPRLPVLRSIPAGALVGLAMAIKLTPGVFVIHYLVCRRWREAGTAVATATALSVGAWLLLPEASFAFWGGALSDPTRLGPNDGTANQAFRALLLRRGLEAGSTGLLLAWVPYLLVVGALCFWLARRAYRQGDWLMEVAVVGLAGFLLSPVSWVHHLHWLMVIVPAILGPGPWRSSEGRTRAVLAAVPFVWFVCTMPFWGVLWRRAGRDPAWVSDVLQEGNVIGSLVILAILAWCLTGYRRTSWRSSPSSPSSSRRSPSSSASSSPAG